MKYQKKPIVYSKKIWAILFVSYFHFPNLAKANEAPLREVAECGVAEFIVDFDPNICGWHKPTVQSTACGVTFKEKQSLKCPGHQTRTYWGKIIWPGDLSPEDNSMIKAKYCEKEGEIGIVSAHGFLKTLTGKKREEFKSRPGGRVGFTTGLAKQFE